MRSTEKRALPVLLRVFDNARIRIWGGWGFYSFLSAVLNIDMMILVILACVKYLKQNK